MDDAVAPGAPSPLGCLLRDADVQRREFAAVLGRPWPTYFEAERRRRFLKAIAEGDKSTCDTLLRLWGIR